MDSQLQRLFRQYLAETNESLAIQILQMALRAYDAQVLGPLATYAVESLLHKVDLTPAISGELPTPVYPRTAKQIQEVIDAISTRDVFPTKHISEWRDDGETCGSVSFVTFPSSDHPHHYRLNLWYIGEAALAAFDDASHGPFMMNRAVDELVAWLEAHMQSVIDGDPTLDINMWARHPNYPEWGAIAGPEVNGIAPYCVLVPAEVQQDARGIGRLVITGLPVYHYRVMNGPSFDIPVS